MVKMLDKIKEKAGIKTYKISDETYHKVVAAIKKERPEWKDLNEEILIWLLKIAVKQFPSEMFDKLTEEELSIKIKNAFIATQDKFGHLANATEIMKLNDAFARGRKMGLKSKGMFKRLLKLIKFDKELKTTLDDAKL